MAELLVDLWPLYVTIGAVVVAGGLSSARDAKASWNWPLADAVITDVSKVDKDEPSEPGDSTVTYSMQVRYSYHVDDATYRGSHPAYSYGHVWKSSKAPELVNKYRPGRLFQVRYRPDRPRDHSVKGPKNPGGGYGNALLGVSIVIASAILGVGGMSVWPAAIGVPTMGAVGAVIWMIAYPRQEVKEGLLYLYEDEP